eukprot:ANDGO_01422.mRNA.1 Prolyl 3
MMQTVCAGSALPLISYPYPHAHFEHVFSDSFLRGVRAELQDLLSAKFKETDLFKVHQTGELSLMDELPAEQQSKLSRLIALRNTLYSSQFKTFVSAMTGITDLSDRVDCAANFYEPGCHLLCHDDGMSTRRVSYILYLSEPDAGWTEADGGALELYETHPVADLVGNSAASSGVAEDVAGMFFADVNPAKSILPAWNSMVLFPVRPGISVHSVQEVYSSSKTRISIQGWFHGPTTIPQIERGTLSQITNRKVQQHAPHPQWKPLGTPIEISDRIQEEDLVLNPREQEYLEQFLSPAYLQMQNMQRIASQFATMGRIQLTNFLRDDLAKPIAALVREQDDMIVGRTPSYASGVTDGWVAVGPPHLQRFLTFDSGKITAQATSPVGKHLESVRSCLTSDAFAKWIAILTQNSLAFVRGQIRRFRPGLDYTVGAFSTLTENVIVDAMLTFVVPSNKWKEGEIGGFDCYVPADLDAVAKAEEYAGDAHSSEDDSEVIDIAPGPNVLSIVERPPKTLRFTKYVASCARGSRWDVSAEFIDHLDETP